MAEKLKNVLIFLLSLTMVALLGVSLTLGVRSESGVLAFLSSIYQQGDESQQGEQSLEPEAAAFPTRIAVTNNLGVYSAWHEEDYARLYGAILSIYSEALGSISEPEQIDEQRYIELHTYPSIHLGFSAGLPLYIHYAWTGSGLFDWQGGERPVKSIVIGRVGDTVALAFYSGGGEYYLAQTGTSVSRLENVCDSIADEPNCIFAFQNPSYSNLACDELVYNGVLELPTYDIEAPDYVGGGELPRQVLEAFSMRHYLAGFFVSGTGAIQYVEGAMELAVGLGGELVYTNSSSENPIGSGLAPGSPGHRAQAVERARDLVADIWSKTGSVGRLSLDFFEYEGGVYYLGFEILLGGYSVDVEVRPAYVVIEGGCVTTVGVRPYTAQVSGTASIPYAQLAAAVKKQGDGLAGVLYARRGDSIRPVMAVVEDES